MDNVARLSLGVMYPVLVLALGLGSFFVSYAELPARIAVHFDITRMPTTSLATPTFGILMVAILIIAVFACIFVSGQKGKLDADTYIKIASYGGFFTAVSSSLIAGAVAIHRGLSDWQDATGPGWWILLVVFAGVLGATLTKLLATRIHSPGAITLRFVQKQE